MSGNVNGIIDNCRVWRHPKAAERSKPKSLLRCLPLMVGLHFVRSNRI